MEFRGVGIGFFGQQGQFVEFIYCGMVWCYKIYSYVIIDSGCIVIGRCQYDEMSFCVILD